MPAGTAPWSCTQRSGPAPQPGHAEKLTAIGVNRIKAAYVARRAHDGDRARPEPCSCPQHADRHRMRAALEARRSGAGAHDGRRPPHPGWARRPGLSGLHHPAFYNPLPAARDGPLTDGAAACEYTMRFVRVPELTAEPARQRDEPPGTPMVRYRSSSCQANITFDADRFVAPARTIANAPGEAADQGLSQRRNGPAAVLALPMRTCPGYPVTVPDRLPDPAWSSAARWPGPGIPRARCSARPSTAGAARCPTTRRTTGGRSSYPANTKHP